MITDFIRRNRESEPLLRLFAGKNVIPASQLFDFPDELLGLLVKDNILYYDPVEGLYGIQGKSLEWGIKGYFAD
jgi:hypothetical protein